MEEKKKGARWKSLLVVLVGAVLIGLGGASVFSSDTVNNILVQSGAEQMATGIVEEYPDSTAVMAKVADVIDAAIEARQSEPSKLADLLNEELGNDSVVSGLPVKALLSAVMDQVNAAYKPSDTEERYTEKLRCIAVGIRKALADSAAEEQ